MFKKRAQIKELQEQSTQYLNRANELKKENQELKKNLELMKKREVEAKRKTRRLSRAEKQFYVITTDLMEIKKRLEVADAEQLEDQEKAMLSAMTEKLMDKLSSNEFSEVAVDESGDMVVPQMGMLEGLGSFGFRNNHRLRTIELPTDMTEIPRSFFYGCTNLQAISIPASVRKIDEYAFYGCQSLSIVSFAPNCCLEELGDFAFAGCENLSRIALPAGVCRLGSGVFRNCHALAAVQLKEAEKLTHIGSHAFQYCTKLVGFKLPPNLKTVETSLFYGCSILREVRIPAGVEVVGNYAFSDCQGLKMLVFESEETHLMPLALAGVPETTLIELSDGRKFIRNTMAKLLEDLPDETDAAPGGPRKPPLATVPVSV